MELRNEIYRLNKLHRLIKTHRTGSPQELAEKLHISRRHLYNVLEDLRMLGARIDYSRSDYTYYYTNHFELRLNLEVEYLDENEKICTIAGSLSHNVMFVHGMALSLQS